MQLTPGDRLGPYEIVAPLGAGGMGEVYRARDPRLGRDVAVKVLPAEVAQDAERLARFAREAQVLASLNHPNIAAIHGLEESDGVRALVMELAEGPTLADRILAGPIPLDEALPIARQIAEALESAHERGIIHRDLKPANVKVKEDGTVKVLDFGLAKAMEAVPSGAPELSRSPTISLAATRAGIILGTAAYMAPEQARGKSVDARADIWAFGAVLYEMLAGKPPFAGEDVTLTLASVVKDTPDWSRLPHGVPPAIRTLLERCLEKDPRQRLRDIGEARIAIDRYLAHPDSTAEAIPRRASPWPWAAAALAGAVAAGATIGWWRASRPVEQPLLRLSVELGTEILPDTTYGASVAVSPDGSRIVFAGRDREGRVRLYMRTLSQPQVAPMGGTEGGRAPFFSPDGRWIGFVAEGKLKKIAVEGGAAVTLCDAVYPRGASWGDDGRIAVALTTAGGLSHVPWTGGTPAGLEVKREAGESTHRWPQMLPGSGAVLFTSGGTVGFDSASIEVVNLKTGERKTLHRGGTYARYVRSGHLVFVHRGALFAAPFDLRRLAVTGPAAPVVEEVVWEPTGGSAQYAVSDGGTLVYLAGKVAGANVKVVWLDSSGKTQDLRATPGDYTTPRFSPDGKRLALTVTDAGNADIWVYDWQRDTPSRLTFSPAADSWPVWTPDGKHIVFRSSPNIYWTRSDGAGEALQLTDSPTIKTPYSFSPDGRRLAYAELSASSGWDIWTLPLDITDPERPKPGKPEPFLITPGADVGAAFSPDGRWIAYASNESGAMEVYVRPFPGPGGKWQISGGGGTMPVWSPSGRELFYRTPDSRIMVARCTANADAFSHEKPRLWSERRFTETSFYTNFDLAPDGKRFAVTLAPEGEAARAGLTHATFLLNFFDELRRRVPAR